MYLHSTRTKGALLLTGFGDKESLDACGASFIDLDLTSRPGWTPC